MTKRSAAKRGRGNKGRTSFLFIPESQSIANASNVDRKL
jgi:hypothetical protein